MCPNPKHRVLHVKIQSNNQDVVINFQAPNSKLWLYNYAIKGVPVTGSVPNEMEYHLVIEGQGFSMSDWWMNHSGRGVPLLLTGEYTAQWLPTELLICEDRRSSLPKIRLSLLNSDGTNATFTEAVFTFHIEVE